MTASAFGSGSAGSGFGSGCCINPTPPGRAALLDDPPIGTHPLQASCWAVIRTHPSMERQLARYLTTLPLTVPYFLPLITYKTLSRNVRTRLYFPGLFFIALPTPLAITDYKEQGLTIRDVFTPTFDLIRKHPIHRRLVQSFLLTELQDQLKQELNRIWDLCDLTKGLSQHSQLEQLDGYAAWLTSLPEIAGTLRYRSRLYLEFPLLGRMLEMPVDRDQVTIQ